jgi:alkanesulfonate monooxygenase SsuD/methylene tetrahydromethanopterin reductase-like flavin-dependent oxidoreductase (luciferase family)
MCTFDLRPSAAPENMQRAMRMYRDDFRLSHAPRWPHLMVAVQVIAAETDAAARRLFTTPQQRLLRSIRNHSVELLLAEVAKEMAVAA